MWWDRLGGKGQPLRLRALEGEQLMGPDDLYQYGMALSEAACMSMRFSQSAAAPMNDEPPRPGRGARLWLRALDGLFVALSEQAAGDPMLSSLLEGCLVRAFRRRHRLACWAANRSLPVEEVGRQLCLCLDEMRRTVDPVAHRLQKISADMKRLGQSLGRNGLGKSSSSGENHPLTALADPMAWPALVKVLVCFCAVLLAGRLKINLGIALGLGGPLLALWTGIGYEQVPAVLADAIAAPLTLRLALLVLLIMILSRLMQLSGRLQRIVDSFNLLVQSPGAVAAVMPALIGLLPMPGGALFSAPMVEAANPQWRRQKDQASMLATINYWFRHHGEYWWPLYPGGDPGRGAVERAHLAIRAGHAAPGGVPFSVWLVFFAAPGEAAPYLEKIRRSGLFTRLSGPNSADYQSWLPHCRCARCWNWLPAPWARNCGFPRARPCCWAWWRPACRPPCPITWAGPRCGGPSNAR